MLISSLFSLRIYCRVIPLRINTRKYLNPQQTQQIHTMGSMLCKEYKTNGKVTPSSEQNSGKIHKNICMYL